MNYKNQIVEKYDIFYTAENTETKEKLRAEIKALAAAHPEMDSHCYHIVALVDYESDDWKENIDQIIQNLQKALALDADNFLAQLYLAHCYHDTQKFELALENYRKVDQNQLQEFQTWRYVKLLEQIGYCEYKLGNKKIGEFYFSQVLEWYKKLPEVDRAVPSELLECLPKNHWIVIEIKKIETYLD
ncbi:MAG: hypothetical protein AAF611_21645 [Bacteroidota bacterium]